jgi:hypothetical protein
MLSSSEISSNKNQIKFPVKPVYYTLLLAGAALRLIPYFLNRSLWLDEAKLALNITDRSFIGLLQPLDYGQVAPVLFLFIEKVNILLFGNSEYSLRLFPLLCGLLSLPLIYRLTKTLTGNAIAALIALFILSTSCLIIYYSGEVKQYECDLFAALCLLNLVFDPALHSNENKRHILLAIAGSVLIFLSNITVLVLFTIAVYYLCKYGLGFLFKRRLLLAAFSSWAIFFSINYFCFLYNSPNRAYQNREWHNDFMPLQFFSLKFPLWIYVKFLSLFDFYALPFVFVFLITIVLFITKRQWLFLFFLLFPLFLHFAVSGFELYPFYTRLILYLAAFITPMISLGLFEIIEVIRKRLNKYAAIIVLAGVLSFMPIALAKNNYIWHEEEIRNSIDFINSNIQPGQKVYVYYGAQFAIMYYERINYVSFEKDIIYGTPNRTTPQNYLNEINNLNGEVWLLFSHDMNYINNEIYNSEEDYIMKQLLGSGTVNLLNKLETTGSAAYLVYIKPYKQ